MLKLKNLSTPAVDDVLGGTSSLNASARRAWTSSSIGRPIEHTAPAAIVEAATSWVVPSLAAGRWPLNAVCESVF